MKEGLILLPSQHDAILIELENEYISLPIHDSTETTTTIQDRMIIIP